MTCRIKLDIISGDETALESVRSSFVKDHEPPAKSPETRKVIVLPEHAKRLQERIEELWGALFDGQWTVGGGSVLAARWNHRFSTDLDTGCTAAAWAESSRRYGKQGLEQRIETALRGLTIEAITVGQGLQQEGILIEKVRESHTNKLVGSISLWPERGVLEPEPVEPVQGSRSLAWGSAEILIRKLLGRGSAMLPRDVYDYAVAGQAQPAAWRQAIAAIPRPQLIRLKEEAVKTQQGRWQERDIIDPSYPALAKGSPWVLETMLQDEEDRRSHEARNKRDQGWER